VSELTEKDISNVVVQWTKLTIVFLKTNSFLTCSLFPDVCLGVSCTYGSKCVLDATSGISHMCACNSICRQYYDPVCGSDGQTYNNECLMNVSRCSTNRAITVVSRGKCSGGNFIVVRLCCRTEILTGGTLQGGLSMGDSQRGTLWGWGGGYTPELAIWHSDLSIYRWSHVFNHSPHEKNDPKWRRSGAYIVRASVFHLATDSRMTLMWKESVNAPGTPVLSHRESWQDG
jgi:hypothetical protein